MKIVYLDCETTSLRPGRICQLSYIVETDEKLTGKNFFFEVDEMDPEAEYIHGLSIDMLRMLSGGRKLHDIKFELLEDLDGALIVGHNISFDISFINHEFNDIRICNESFCTMNHFTDIVQITGYKGDYKWPRLAEVIQFLDITGDEIMNLSKEIFKADGTSFHDSRYDVSATYLIYKKGLRQRLIPKTDVAHSEYVKKKLEQTEKKIYRYSTEYKSIENKILHLAIKKYFDGAKNITETQNKIIQFKWENHIYEATIGSDYSVLVNSRMIRENGIEKSITYKISRKKVNNIIFEDLDYAEILSMFWSLGSWLSRQEGKCSYLFPVELEIIMNNIDVRNKAKEIGLIFYSSGWGWRLRKNWEDNLQREYESHCISIKQP